MKNYFVLLMALAILFQPVYLLASDDAPSLPDQAAEKAVSDALDKAHPAVDALSVVEEDEDEDINEDALDVFDEGDEALKVQKGETAAERLPEDMVDDLDEN